MESVKIFGHRGAAGLVAENTIESIRKALEFEVDGIEIDVHCCKSGELIVIHDNTLDRTTNGSGAVEDFTLEELRKLSTKEGFLVPTLEEVLISIDACCSLNIELKGKNTALPTLSLIQKYVATAKWDHEQFIVSSFDHEQLIQFRENTSQYKIGVLTEDNITAVLKTAILLDAYSVHPPASSLLKSEVDLARSKGFKVFVWTVNDKSLMKQFKLWKVDGIITDFPNFAKTD
ncbi:glycerophosphodiester phosphodiesterase [Aquimarina sp. D1M17]|uniref:glycerophosphodiester phosphodiesterase n=1 Tax=Aquimarina acroporae TaxID=2937283 RepID=UPI0020BFA297|nr:glycerophosphodiester phosphodiesterase family protein [Aquimarina acroporae]MCK8521100.1 glycerophosphodiester phosphodiesterase [Aquimarina acroporae]